MISSVTLANTFIERYGAEGLISHLKLQKLCYYADGWWLALCSDKEGRLCKERPQVWKFGPVFYPVYSTFVSFGNEPITQPRRATPFGQPEMIGRDTSSQQSSLVDWIWTKYGALKATELSEMTHAPDTPWYKIASDYDFHIPRFTEIPDDINKQYFQTLAERSGIPV